MKTIARRLHGQILFLVSADNGLVWSNDRAKAGNFSLADVLPKCKAFGVHAFAL